MVSDSKLAGCLSICKQGKQGCVNQAGHGFRASAQHAQHDGRPPHLVHDVSGEVCVAEGDDAVLNEAPALVEVLSGADLLLKAGG